MMCKCGSKEDADANLEPKINEMVLDVNDWSGQYTMRAEREHRHC